MVMGKAFDKDERFMVVVDEASSDSNGSVCDKDELTVVVLVEEARSNPRNGILGDWVNELNDGVWTNNVSQSLSDEGPPIESDGD